MKTRQETRRTKKLISGYVVQLGGAAVSCKHSCIVLSTTESEYIIALCAASQEAVWLQQLMDNLLNKTVHKALYHF